MWSRSEVGSQLLGPEPALRKGPAAKAVKSWAWYRMKAIEGLGQYGTAIRAAKAVARVGQRSQAHIRSY